MGGRWGVTVFRIAEKSLSKNVYRTYFGMPYNGKCIKKETYLWHRELPDLAGC